MTLTKEIFIERAEQKHNYFYDYSCVNFINTKLKVDIICPYHGSFSQKAENHLRGDRCPSCTGNKKLNNNLFLEKAYKIHHHKYDYSLINVINGHTKVDIICKEHGVFSQSPSKHLLGHNCPKCSRLILSKKQTLTLKIFLEKANKIHNFKYNYDLVVYKSAKNKIKIKCPDHGVFMQTPSNHLMGHGCPNCRYNISKLETKWLDELNIQERHKTLNIKNKRVIVDGYNNNIVYEFYGDFWHGNPKIFNSDEINPMNNQSFGKLYNDTLKREKLIKSAGFDIISIWESDFIKKIKQ